MKTLQNILKSVYGISGTHRINPLVAACQNVVTRLLPQNPNRLAFIIVNLSAQNIYLSPDGHPAADHGIWLAPNGGSFIVQWDKDLILPGLPWYGLAGAADCDIYIIEIISN